MTLVALCARSEAGAPGDVNGDGVVDTYDLTALVEAVNARVPAGAAMRADINRDGRIDSRDISDFLALLSGARGDLCEVSYWPCCEYLPPWGCCGDIDICQDDDEKDDVGGPGDFDADGGGDVGGGGGVTIISCDDCDDFRAWGPNYAGPGDPVGAWATTTSPGVFCGRRVSIEIISGAHLLVNGVAGDTPGTVRLRASVELPNGTICEDTHEVQIVRYEPVRLRYATFIECSLLANPGGWIPTVASDYFGGDGRGPSSTAASYRSCHEIDVAPHQFSVSGPETFPYDLTPFGVTNAVAPPFGTSHGYSSSTVVSAPPPCPHSLAAGATPVTMATLAVSAPPMTTFGGSGASFVATYSGNHVSYVRRLSPSVVRVYFWLAGGNPLFVGAPAINGYVRWTLIFGVNQQTGARQSHVSYDGIHNAFPAHELYINGIALYSFSSISAGTTPAALAVPLNEVTSPQFGASVLIQN